MTSHKWTGKLNYVPGEPDDYVEYCDNCGMEKPDESESIPECPPFEESSVCGRCGGHKELVRVGDREAKMGQIIKGNPNETMTFVPCPDCTAPSQKLDMCDSCGTKMKKDENGIFQPMVRCCQFGYFGDDHACAKQQTTPFPTSGEGNKVRWSDTIRGKISDILSIPTKDWYDRQARKEALEALFNSELQSALSLRDASWKSKIGEAALDQGQDRKKSQIIVELFNDGKWWCINGPGCESLACAGHDSFEDWATSVSEEVNRVAENRLRK